MAYSFLYFSVVYAMLIVAIMADITPRKRSVIIALHQHNQESSRIISRKTGVSQATVSRIIRQFQTTGSVTPKRKGNCGRKRKTSPKDDCYISKKSKQDPSESSVEIKKDLAEAGVEISASLVRRRLVASGRRARRPSKKQLLTRGMKKKRVAWARKYKDWTKDEWKNVLFSDESHFMVQGQQKRYVRRSQGEMVTEQHINQTVKHPQKKMFWGSFSFNGVGSLYPVSGMMNADKYIDVIQHKVVRDMQTAFPDGRGIFQQDLAPCHAAKKVKKVFQENQIKVLEWPGNSPDLNPIENLWAIIKNQLRSKDCSNLTRLIEAVIAIWFHDEEIAKSCQNLVCSMPKRVKQVLKNKGGHISY